MPFTHVNDNRTPWQPRYLQCDCGERFSWPEDRKKRPQAELNRHAQSCPEYVTPEEVAQQREINRAQDKLVVDYDTLLNAGFTDNQIRALFEVFGDN